MSDFDKYRALLFALDVIDTAGFMDSRAAESLRDAMDECWRRMSHQERGTFAEKPEVDYYGPCPVCGGNHFLTARSLVPIPYENGNGICTRCHEKAKFGGGCEA